MAITLGRSGNPHPNTMTLMPLRQRSLLCLPLGFAALGASSPALATAPDCTEAVEIRAEGTPVADVSEAFEREGLRTETTECNAPIVRVSKRADAYTVTVRPGLAGEAERVLPTLGDAALWTASWVRTDRYSDLLAFAPTPPAETVLVGPPAQPIAYPVGAEDSAEPKAPNKPEASSPVVYATAQDLLAGRGTTVDATLVQRSRVESPKGKPFVSLDLRRRETAELGRVFAIRDGDTLYVDPGRARPMKNESFGPVVEVGGFAAIPDRVCTWVQLPSSGFTTCETVVLLADLRTWETERVSRRKLRRWSRRDRAEGKAIGNVGRGLDEEWAATLRLLEYRASSQ